MCFLKPILSAHKLMLLIFLIHIAESGISFEDFIVGNLRTYRRHWPLKPNGVFTIGKNRYSIEKSVFEQLRDPFNSYIVPFREYFILVGTKSIFVLKDNKTEKSNQPMLTDACAQMNLTNIRVRFQIIISTDEEGVDHLFGIPYNQVSQFNLDNLTSCDFNLPDEKASAGIGFMRCFQTSNSKKKKYAHLYFHCVFEADIGVHVTRACSDGKTDYQIVGKPIEMGGQRVPIIAATIVTLGTDIILYVIFVGDDLLIHAFNMNEIEKEITAQAASCLKLAPNTEKVDDCKPRENEQLCLNHYPYDRHISSLPVSNYFLDIITFEQDEPIKFNKLFIVEVGRATLISVQGSVKKGLQHKIAQRDIALHTGGVQFTYDGEYVQYFFKNSSEVHSLTEIGLPCIILDPIYCFLFEKSLKCNYNETNDFCAKGAQPSGIQEIETNLIQFSINPLIAPSKENRNVVLTDSEPIFHDWILQDYLPEVKVICTPNDTVKAENIVILSSRNYFNMFQLRFRATDKLSLKTQINIKLELVFKSLNKAVKIENDQVITLTDPSIISVTPNYVFTHLKDAQFSIEYSAVPSDIDKVHFRFKNSDFTKIDNQFVKGKENLFKQTVKIEHEFQSPQQHKIQLIYAKKRYHSFKFEVRKKPVLPEIWDKVIFSEAKLKLTWNGTGIETLYEPRIAVISRDKSELVFEECQVENNFTCAYPNLPNIDSSYRTYLFFYSHHAQLNPASSLLLTYLPAPSKFYAYTAENYVKLSGNDLHYTYPLKIILINKENKEKLNCSTIEPKINNAKGMADFFCYLKENLYDQSGWMLSVTIGKWSASSVNVKLIPKPSEDPSGLKSLLITLLLIITFIVTLALTCAFLIKSRFKSKFKIKINKKKVNFALLNKRKKQKGMKPSTATGVKVKLKKRDFFDSTQATEATTIRFTPINTNKTETAISGFVDKFSKT